MSKYKNKKVVIDGMTFDSTKEGRFYLFLKEKEKNGEVSNLRRQVPYELIPEVLEDEIKHLKTKDKIVKRCVQRATHYLADFVYTDSVTGEDVVIDVKSDYTRRLSDYRLKKKMMRAFKGISIIEV